MAGALEIIARRGAAPVRRSQHSPGKVSARAIASALALLVVASGCSAKAGSGADAPGTGEVKTGPGVTADTIKLGVLVPLTGPIGPLGKAGVAGAQIYWDQQNAEAGVCGRKIELVAKDNQYNVQKSVVQYATLRDEVLGVQNMAGGADILAVQQRLKSDRMVVMAGSYDSALLKVPTVAVPGSPYDVEAINGISYLVDEKKIASGDTIGVIHYSSGVGPNVLKGARAAAKHFGLEVAAKQIDPAATDVTAQVSAMKAAGAKAIVMGTAGTQTVAVSSLVRAGGFDATVLATNLISATDVKGPAEKALTSNLVLTGNSLPLSAGNDAAAALIKAYQRQNPGSDPTAPVGAGYVFGNILHRVLEQACENKDLTREGVAKAMRQLKDVDADGMQVSLDFSKPGQPASRETFILRPDPTTFDGVSVIKDAHASELAKSYSVSR